VGCDVQLSFIDTIKNLGIELGKYLFDVGTCFGWALQKINFILLGETHAFFITNFSIFFLIWFVPDKNEKQLLMTVRLRLFKPACHVSKTFTIGDVITQHSTNSILIVSTRDWLEAFLACLH
jgi:hypothetical protein